MVICVAYFIRDTAGAMKLNSAAPVQYVRPEITGIVLGTTSMSFIKKRNKFCRRLFSRHSFYTRHGYDG